VLQSAEKNVSSLAVALHDHLIARAWLVPDGNPEARPSTAAIR
jgi:hypothetical protein